MAVERVVKAGRSGEGNVLPDDERLAALHTAQGFIPGDIQTVLVVLPLLAAGRGRVAPGLKLLLGAKARVGRAALHQLHRVGQVGVAPLGLDVGAVVAAHVRALVVFQPRLTQALVDQLHRAGHLALLVGVLDAQDELAPVLLGEQVGVEGGAQSAQVQVTRRAGCEPGAYSHWGSLLYGMCHRRLFHCSRTAVICRWDRAFFLLLRRCVLAAQATPAAWARQGRQAARSAFPLSATAAPRPW